MANRPAGGVTGGLPCEDPLRDIPAAKRGDGGGDTKRRWDKATRPRQMMEIRKVARSDCDALEVVYLQSALA